MNTSLEFSEEQLCELWTQHTSLEDDPRDANNDLRLAFEDEDALRQELTVAPDVAEEESNELPMVGARFERVRAARDAGWSAWTRVS